jgi:FkbH-like protein
MSVTTESADSILRALRQDDTLAAGYHRVAALLHDADPDTLRRCGAVLALVDPDDVSRHHPTLPVVTVSVTGSTTLAPLVRPLHAELARHGFVPRIQVGGYRQYQVELRDPTGPVFEVSPDLTLCLLDADEVFAGLATPWTVDDVRRALDELGSSLATLAEAHARDHPGLLVFNTVPLVRHWSAQVVDHRSKARLGAAWREFNAALLRLAADRPGIVVLDSEPLLAETGPLTDARLARYAHARLGDDFLAGYAREIGHLARAVRGRTSKCLVLDLDGTMWGGTLAEDGPDGIHVADGPHGEAHHAFQLAARQLGSQGPLLAVCSKNDAAPVQRALREITELGVTEADLVAVIANWLPKSDNLTQLARQLNIGVDSLVFVDDSPSERGMVRAALPEVPVIAVDAAEPAWHVHRLLADGWFTTLELTDEDRVRGERYRTERQRLEFRETADSLSDYLAGLATTVELRRPTDADIGRIAQLTQRTNQFNLTTVRLDPAGVRRLADDPDTDVFLVRCADRFGSHGTVGALFTRWAGTALVVDNFVLSCRVLARGVESACLGEVLAAARRSGADSVIGAFRPTAKNHRVAGFYPEHGFTVRAPQEPDGTVAFEHPLRTEPEPVPHIGVDSDVNWSARESTHRSIREEEAVR